MAGQPQVGVAVRGEARLASETKQFIFTAEKMNLVVPDDVLWKEQPALAGAISRGEAKIAFAWGTVQMADGWAGEGLFQFVTIIQDGNESTGMKFVSADKEKDIGWLDYIRACCKACHSAYGAYLAAGYAEEVCWWRCMFGLSADCCYLLPSMTAANVYAFSQYLECCRTRCD